jgi:hypothetical protein
MTEDWEAEYRLYETLAKTDHEKLVYEMQARLNSYQRQLRGYSKYGGLHPGKPDINVRAFKVVTVLTWCNSKQSFREIVTEIVAHQHAAAERWTSLLDQLDDGVRDVTPTTKLLLDAPIEDIVT